MDVVTYALAKKYADERIGAAVSSAYTFKGNLANKSDLPLSANVGDVYNVTATGINYAWNGEEWDALGPESAIISGKQTQTSEESGGTNIFTFTDATGATQDFQVKNGEKGGLGYVYFTEENGHLFANIPDDEGAIQFAINENGRLEAIFE